MLEVGTRIRIIEMKGEPSYSGKTGVIYSIDSIGQLHGSWGGLAIIPEQDKVEEIKVNEHICSICKRKFEGFGNNPAPFTGERCCDECNTNYVIPLRIYSITKEQKSAVLFKEDGTVETVKPKGKYYTLEELQKLVGGLIELYPARYRDNYIVCDEEGLIKNRKINKPFKALTGIGLVGNVLLCPEAIFEEPEEDES